MDSSAFDLAAVAEMSAAWGPWWDAALAIQRDNPDVRARALRQSEEFGDAAAGMVMYFALKLHPTILETASAHCRAVLDLLGADPVAGVEYNRDVTDERDGGGQQEAHRVAELEEQVERQGRWLADLEDEVVRLRRLVATAGGIAAQAVRPTNTV